jgi:hypothetical protein
MRISGKLCYSVGAGPPWATSQEALAWLQHEIERRFAETLFGPESLSAEAERAVPVVIPVAADAKITRLWELRTRFGPRGSPPKPFEELPADVRAGLFSVVGAFPVVGSEAGGA